MLSPIPFPPAKYLPNKWSFALFWRVSLQIEQWKKKYLVALDIPWCAEKINSLVLLHSEGRQQLHSSQGASGWEPLEVLPLWRGANTLQVCVTLWEEEASRFGGTWSTVPSFLLAETWIVICVCLSMACEILGRHGWLMKSEKALGLDISQCRVKASHQRVCSTLICLYIHTRVAYTFFRFLMKMWSAEML